VIDDPTIVTTAPPRVVDLSADLDNTCLLHDDATVSCWGDDADGQLAQGSPAGFGKVTQIAMGHNFTCACGADGYVKCAGLDDSGQLGNGTLSGEQPHDVASLVLGLSGVTQLAAGVEHACAVFGPGNVACWGSDLQLVDWHLASVNGLTNVVQLAAGDEYTCALLADETVACWGVNGEGEVGDGTTAYRSRPVPVADLNGVVQIAIGGYHGCALTQSHSVYCWGLNAHGELGDGTTLNRARPTRIVFP
jgi:alpha-tubulin suppressor-like RCC1 family protein